MEISIFLALGSALSFSSASVIFTLFARRISPFWINAFKATVALAAFSIAFVITTNWSQWPTWISMGAFFFSGFVGLNLGDFFLMQAFRSIGSGRTLMIFSFQPIFLGVFAYFLFEQNIAFTSLVAILFMIACVMTVSYERFRLERKWEWKGPLFALIGVLLDCAGILLTRFGFESDAHVTVIEGNFYRCLGAGMGFFIMSYFVPLDFVRRLKRFHWKTRMILVGGSLVGTFGALWMYLTAISIGHLATIAAVVGTGPIFAAIFECLAFRRWPTRYLLVAFFFFGCGFYILMLI